MGREEKTDEENRCVLPVYGNRGGASGFGEYDSSRSRLFLFLARDRKDTLSRIHRSRGHDRDLEGQATIKTFPLRCPRNNSYGLEDCRKVLAPESEGAARNQCRPQTSRESC
jgi:hypothetical protein